MVNRRASLRLTLLLVTAVLFTAFFALNVQPAQAADIQFHLDHEWAEIWINKDGTIDLFYDIEIASDGGTINFVKVGQPTWDFELGEVWDENGNQLQTNKIVEGSYYAVNVSLATPITTGESIRFNLTTNVGHMIWEDTDNPGNVGMQFIPVYWSETVYELKVVVVLPEGVTTGNIRVTPDWDNAFNDPAEDNKLVVYWERQNLSPSQQQDQEFGVSFPKEYVDHYETQPKGLAAFLGKYGLVLLFIAFFIGFIVVIVYVGRKRKYEKPVVSMETLGIRRGLTAVEASQILDLPPTKIVTEILYSLLMKRAVWVTEADPVLKLEIMEEFKDKTGTRETPLRYYEIDFLEAIRKDGTLDEEKLARTVMFLRDAVEEKLRGYCRRDTVEYYRKIVAKAWTQVEQAGTTELAAKAYDENLLWLILDGNFKDRTGSVFRDKTVEPDVTWWWFWYAYTHYHPRPTYKPKPTTTKPGPPPKLPGEDFANNIATAVEKTSNNIVASLEKFANSILPAPPPSARTSRAPVRERSSCACACVSCACVCACVSCACACASGGVG